MKQQNRLYVAGYGAHMVYTLANSFKLAVETLGAGTRVPDSDDIRNFWKISNIASLTEKERMEKFGVSRQALHYWRRKGGTDLVCRADYDRLEREKRVLQVLTEHPGASAKEIAGIAKTSIALVRRVADANNIKLFTLRRMPTDEQLIELAAGKTWRELADAVGMRLACLRNYVYKNKALSEQIRKVRKPAPTGIKAALNKVDLKKVRQMGQKGMTAYAIAEALKVEQMTIRAHLMRWGKERPDDFPPPYGKRLPPGKPVDGGHGGSERQQ